MIRSRLALLLFLIAPFLAHAQTSAGALEAQWKGKQFHLRNFSADPLVHYEWANGGITSDPPHIRTFGLFLPQAVKLKRDLLIITGESATLVRDSATRQVGMAGHSKTTLQVDLQGTDPAQVLPELERQLFFADAQAAHASVPVYLLHALPEIVNGKIEPDPCNCVRIRKSNAWVEIPRKDPAFVQARIFLKPNRRLADLPVKREPAES